MKTTSTSGMKKTGLHVLNTEPEYFEAVKRGDKTFEIRYNDRDFKVGDVVGLCNIETDEKIYRTITYISDYKQQSGYVVLGIKK